ncbi:hypothetical protein ACHQM5_025438 [Ranunculus cassubicifolius]
MMDEIDLMEEDEMEDAVDESVMDIDSDDADNPLAVVEYVDDIYSHYKKTEVKIFAETSVFKYYYVSQCLKLVRT